VRVRLVLLSVWRGLGELYRSEGLTHAAAIAFYALLSLLPFILLLFSVLGSITTDPAARDAVIEFAFRYFPRQFDFVTRQVEAFRTERLSLGLGGFFALAYASLGVFNAMSSAVNHAWGVEKRRGFVRHRLFSFVMMLTAGAIFVAAITLVSALRMAEATWFTSLGLKADWFDRLGGVDADYVVMALLIGCVALIFRFVPNERVHFSDVWPGAVLTAILWRIAFALFAWYTADLAGWSVHGSVAAVVVFLLWIYICAVLLLYGVEVTAVYSRLRDLDRATADPRAAEDPTVAAP
jgi:membrane protein